MGITRSLLVALVALPLGCGRLDYDERIEVTPDSGATSSPFDPFESAQLVTELIDPNAREDDPELSSDGLELYFARRVGSEQHIWVATRSQPTGSWSTPSRVEELVTTEAESGPALSADGLSMWFAHQDVGGGTTSIWVTRRASRSAAWQAGTPVAELAGGSRRGSSVFNGGLSMVFNSADDGSTRRLFLTTRATTSSPWQTPVALSELDTPDGERNPYVRKDGLVIYFTANTNRGDLYVAARDALTEPFGSPVKLETLATASPDDDASLSSDERVIYFSRDDEGDLRIYQATR